MPGLISLVVSTYNQPKYLRLCLNALMHQTDSNFEILVADDGSKEATKAVVDAAAAASPVSLRHVWHEDKGFRLAAIRNRAAVRASGDYLIFMDGDCLAPPDFIATHRALAQKSCHVIGQRVFMAEPITKELLAMQVEPGAATPRFTWRFPNFAEHFMKRDINRLLPFLLKLPASGSLARFRTRNPKALRKNHGCNWGIWTEDYAAVNGFDEAFEGWGAEDTDLAIRLANHGLGIKLGTCCNYVLHMWHKPNYATKTFEERKTKLIEDRLASGSCLPVKGMNPPHD